MTIAQPTSAVPETDPLQGLKTGLGCMAFVLDNLGVPSISFDVTPGDLEAVDESRSAAMAHPEAARSVDRLMRVAERAGVDAELVTASLDDFISREWTTPRIAVLTSGNFVVVCGRSLGRDGKLEKLFLFDPLALSRSRTLWVAVEAFGAAWSKLLIEVRGRTIDHGLGLAGSAEETVRQQAAEAASAAGVPQAGNRFGFAWFGKYLLENKRFFRDVAVISLFMHLLSLAPPIFFQIVVDRVLVHHVYETLVALGIGVMVAIGFNTLFEYVRDRILLHAANRIDASIGPATFTHLTNLPLHYFDPRPVGVLVKHMQQPEAIREFLAGQLLVTILNASVLVVIIPLLFFYNATLALLTLGIASILLITILVLIIPLRRRLYELYLCEGGKQAMLVEALQGIATVKSLAIEDLKRAEWNAATAAAIEARYKVQRLQVAVRTILGFFDQAMMVAIIVVGALFVIGGAMTVGALIAFQMLAGRVTSPLLELIGLTHQIQETSLSVRMLGNVMNAAPEEAEKSPKTRPPIDGAIRFERLSFTYPTTRSPVLKDLSLDIGAGEFVGIVGRSGSGKTTLTRLLLGHYLPDEGAIYLGSANSRDVDRAYLRKQVSMVLQDTFLFTGTVFSNIAASNPAATYEEIEAAAEAAGAAEFIERMPNRYETQLEEGGRNLSGGQRQRLGLARALLVRRPILVLDEATSSLDPESEGSIRDGLPQIRRGRTVILISHKLSLMTETDRIFVIEGGRRVQEGHHTELVEMPGLYSQLWRQQSEPYQPGAVQPLQFGPRT